MANEINIIPTEVGTNIKAIPDLRANVFTILTGAALAVSIVHRLGRKPVGIIVFDATGHVTVFTTLPTTTTVTINRSADVDTTFYIY